MVEAGAVAGSVVAGGEAERAAVAGGDAERSVLAGRVVAVGDSEVGEHILSGRAGVVEERIPTWCFGGSCRCLVVVAVLSLDLRVSVFTEPSTGVHQHRLSFPNVAARLTAGPKICRCNK